MEEKDWAQIIDLKIQKTQSIEEFKDRFDDKIFNSNELDIRGVNKVLNNYQKRVDELKRIQELKYDENDPEQFEDWIK